MCGHLQKFGCLDIRGSALRLLRLLSTAPVKFQPRNVQVPRRVADFFVRPSWCGLVQICNSHVIRASVSILGKAHDMDTWILCKNFSRGQNILHREPYVHPYKRPAILNIDSCDFQAWHRMSLSFDSQAGEHASETSNLAALPV